MGKDLLMTGLFPDRESVELGYDPLSDRGYTIDDVHVMMSEDTRKRFYSSGGNETDLGIAAACGWSHIPQERIKKYDEGIRNGGILLGVRPRNDQDAAYFENAWRIIRAQDVCR